MIKIICCVEFYAPIVGGAQEVVRQLAERLASRGNHVTVVTTRITERTSSNLNGVHIVDFNVNGNQVRGMYGEVKNFQTFLLNADADLIFFYAAQQWTFDAAWAVLPQIKAKKVLVPCGYSCLYLDAYTDYFRTLPKILSQLDAVVYHAESYRDIDFARQHNLNNSMVIPNGAALEEFQAPIDAKFRESIGVDEDTLVLLTVGTVTGLKGHLELAHSFALTNFGERSAVLVLNGNKPKGRRGLLAYIQGVIGLIRSEGPCYAVRQIVYISLRALGWRGGNANPINNWVTCINQGQYGNKRVLFVDLPRPKLIQAYFQANLFVFASNIEYSPLVLFEACAAGLPFLSVPVGNSPEIAQWTGGGVICDASVDEEGYTRTDPAVLAQAIEDLFSNPQQMSALSSKGKEASETRYNWGNLTTEYEQLFMKLLGRDERVIDGILE